jgi:urease accessory protein
MTVRVSQGATFYLLPDPVTCFKHASYNQIQTFHLEDGASLIVLDSFTSGRKSLGEEWEFWRYYSVNDVWVNGSRVAKDVMLLEQEKEGEVKTRWGNALPARKLADRLTPYSCYATAILHGPTIHETLSDVSRRSGEISVFKKGSPPPLLWSFSWVGSQREGGVIRVAATDTEGVRDFLKELLHGIKTLVGIDTYQKAFP